MSTLSTAGDKLIEFIARARLVNAKPKSVEYLFHTQAAAVTELARRAIQYANEVRTRSLSGRLGALGECSIARVLYDFTVSKIVQPSDRLAIEMYLSKKCGIGTPMQKLCSATGTTTTFGADCEGEAEAADDKADLEVWQVVDALAALLYSRGPAGRLPRAGVINAARRMVTLPPTAPPPPQ